MNSRSLTAVRRQRGFSMFELMVYLLVVSILFATVVNRYREFPGEAERANFMAVLAQLKAGVNLQMINAIAKDNWHSLRELDASNPMDLMLEVPSNYLGEFTEVDPAAISGRTWYFDTSVGELVYTAQSAQNLYLVLDGVRTPANQIRFKIGNVFADEAQTQWQGIVLAPVVPYDWRSVPIEAAITPES